jgi:hypothetical protein
MKLLEKMLETYDLATLWAATGWFLERYRTAFHPPEKLLARCERNRPASPHYLARRERGGTLARRWNLYPPAAVMEGEPDEREPRVSVPVRCRLGIFRKFAGISHPPRGVGRRRRQARAPRQVPRPQGRHGPPALGTPDRIEVDLNYLFRTPLEPVAGRPVWQPGDLDRPQVRTVGLTELLVGKMVALLARSAPRDLWDVVNLPEEARDRLRTQAFRSWFVGIASVLNHPLSTYGAQ